MTPTVRLISAVLCFAALAAGCSGGGGAPTEPAAALVTLTISGGYIEVVEDCDGIEGDGDFAFVVEYGESSASDVVLDETINLGPGGKSRTIARWTRSFDQASDPFILVTFRATELDRSVTSIEYADARLDNATESIGYRVRDGAWTGLGPQSITLGGPGCLVRLHWSAEKG